MKLKSVESTEKRSLRLNPQLQHTFCFLFPAANSVLLAELLRNAGKEEEWLVKVGLVAGILMKVGIGLQLFDLRVHLHSLHNQLTH